MAAAAAHGIAGTRASFFVRRDADFWDKQPRFRSSLTTKIAAQEYAQRKRGTP